jgi:hypothetical protein
MSKSTVLYLRSLARPSPVVGLQASLKTGNRASVRKSESRLPELPRSSNTGHATPHGYHG